MCTRNIRILVVDDVSCVRHVLVATFKVFFGDEVIVETANDLEQALTFNLRDFDLIFADLLLPAGKTGLTILSRLRELVLSTPFVVMTGYTENEVFELLATIAPDEKIEILRKPFSIFEINDLAIALVPAFRE